MAPTMLSLASVVAYGIAQLSYAKHRKLDSMVRAARKFWQFELQAYCLQICMLLYTLLVSSVISPIECIPQQDGSSIMLRNPSVYCHSDEWNVNLGIVIFFSILWVILFPVGVACLLFFWRKNLENPIFLDHFDSILTKPYRKSRFWWEFVELVRRFLFILALKMLPLIGGSSVMSASFFVSCLMIVYIVTDSMAMPYKETATASLSVL